MREPTVYESPSRAQWLDLRRQVVSSTEMAPVAGMPKYGMTRWSLHHIKRGLMEDTFEPSERSEIGLAIEHSIARLARKQLGARTVRMRDFMTRGRLGASFDYEIRQPGHDLDGWLVECKNVDGLVFRDDWDTSSDHRDPQPPDHIAIQVQQQLEVSRRPGCILAVLVGGNRLELIRVVRDPEIGDALHTIAEDFWREIEAGEEPAVVPEDAANVPLVYRYARPDSVIEADDEMQERIERYHRVKREARELDDLAKQLKAELMVTAGDAEKVVGKGGYTLDLGITRGNPGTPITEEMVGQMIGGRKAFRRCVVRRKKATKQQADAATWGE